MDRAEKSELVSTLNSVFADAGTIVVAHYSGMTVADMTAFRAQMREAGARVRVAKNRLAKLALKGTDVDHIEDLFTGPTVIAYSDDPVVAPKVTVDYAKTNQNLVVLGGAMGPTNLNADDVKALAALPSLDELRARLVGMLTTPATRIAQVVSAPAGQVARVVSARAEQQSEAA